MDEHVFSININDHDFRFQPKQIASPESFIPHGEYNPHHLRPWILHDSGFVVAIAFASNAQDALDEMVDANLLDAFQIDDADMDDYVVDPCPTHKLADFDIDCKACQDQGETCSRLGNANEPFDIEALSLIEVPATRWTPDLWTREQLDVAIWTLADNWSGCDDSCFKQWDRFIEESICRDHQERRALALDTLWYWRMALLLSEGEL